MRLKPNNYEISISQRHLALFLANSINEINFEESHIFYFKVIIEDMKENQVDCGMQFYCLIICHLYNLLLYSRAVLSVE